MHMRMHIHMRIHIHVHVRMHIHMHIHVHVRMHMRRSTSRATSTAWRSRSSRNSSRWLPKRAPSSSSSERSARAQRTRTFPLPRTYAHPPVYLLTPTAFPCQVYKKLGNRSDALQYLNKALDLSPKDAQQIKAAINNLDKEDNEEEEQEI